MAKNKHCTRCKQNKSFDQFSSHRNARDGKQSHCKSCVAERARNSRIGKPCVNCSKSKEVGVPKGARLCLSCAKTCYKCKKRERKQQHRMCKQCIAAHDKKRNASQDAKFRQRITRIASKYNVRKALAVVLAASTHCMACGRSAKDAGLLHVDHCHDSGVVRGVLCFNCNAALGHIGDSVSRLESLMRYLSESRADIGGLEDLRKAKHFIDLLIELEANHASDNA